ISFSQIWRRAVTHMFTVAVQKKNGTTQSFRLAFHEKNEAHQDIRQRRIGGDHLENPALTGAKKLFLFDLSDVAANDHAAQHIAVRIAQRTSSDFRPESAWGPFVSHEHLN